MKQFPVKFLCCIMKQADVSLLVRFDFLTPSSLVGWTHSFSLISCKSALWPLYQHRCPHRPLLSRSSVTTWDTTMQLNLTFKTTASTWAERAKTTSEFLITAQTSGFMWLNWYFFVNKEFGNISNWLKKPQEQKGRKLKPSEDKM